MANEALTAAPAGPWFTVARRHGWWLATLGVSLAVAALSLRLDVYLVYVATSWVALGLLGLSLDIVWGRAGILSLGQTAFYGLGGYVGGIVAINFAPLTGNTLIWSLPAGALTGALVATAVGSLIFYGRMGPLQTTILTYTFTLILWTGSIGFSTRIGQAVVGGDNGMSNIPGMTLRFGGQAQPLDPNGMFLTALAVATLIFLGVQAIMRSPVGQIADCIRMNAQQTELLGYDIRRHQLIIFILSGAVAGVAGTLFGSWATYLNPSVFSVQEALLVPIYVLVGGRGTLFGAFVGATAVGGLSFWLGGGVIGGQTTLVMGLTLIVLVLFLRRGLLGGIQDAWSALWALRGTAEKPETTTDWRIEIVPERLTFLAGSAGSERKHAIETKGISKGFGGVVAVDAVSQAFRVGEVRCVIGPNGAGKSTYLRCCMGLLRPDAGRVFLNGADITDWQPFARVQAGIGIKMQIAQVFEELSIRDNLWVAAYGRTRDSALAHSIADDVLVMLGLQGRADRLGSDLAHGEQQWLNIGMVLCLAPGVVLFDEPAAGMTREETRQMAKLIRALADYAAVVVIDHDMEFVRILEAPITVLHQGAVFAEGSIEELRQDQSVLDIYLGRRKHVGNL